MLTRAENRPIRKQLKKCLSVWDMKDLLKKVSIRWHYDEESTDLGRTDCYFKWANGQFRETKDNTITLSAYYWAHIDDKTKKEIIIHEAAHLVATHIAFRKLKDKTNNKVIAKKCSVRHTKLWKNLVKQFDVPVRTFIPVKIKN